MREITYTGERVAAGDALAIGLNPTPCCPTPRRCQHSTALAVARSIAAKSPLAIAGSKLALNYARDHGNRRGAGADGAAAGAIFDTDDIVGDRRVAGQRHGKLRRARRGRTWLIWGRS